MHLHAYRKGVLPLHNRYLKTCLPVRQALMIMKLTAILLVACLQASAVAIGQTVTLSETNVPMKKIFKEIHRQTGYDFLVFSDMLKDTKPVTINVTNEKLETVLELCFKDQPLDYSIDEKTIVVKIKESSVNREEQIQYRMLVKVTGKVTDKKGTAMPGVNVVVKGTTNGTSTDVEGKFTIDANENDVLVFSFIGFKRIEETVGTHTSIDLVMEEDIKSLDEVIVTAYNTTTERKNTAAVTVVKGQEIQTLPSRSFDKSLQGLVPGLLVTNGTGQPGGGVSNFVLRGISTAVQPGSDSYYIRSPLIVIDGIPVTQDYNQLTIDNPNTPIANPLSHVNPSDIETITVLKDAAAVALYGARASNGVIVITTKKGKSGKASFNFRHQTDIATAFDNNFDLLNKDEYLELVIESYKNYNPSYTDAFILSDLRSKFPVVTNGEDTSFYATNWRDELYRSPATTVSNELSISGANENTNYYLNLEWTKQAGVVKNTGFDRKSMRFNFENQVAPWIKLGLNSTFSHTRQDYGTTLYGGFEGPLNYALSPMLPVRLADGSYYLNFDYGGLNSPEANPVAMSEYNMSRNTSYRGLSKLYSEIFFLKHFKLTNSLGVDYLQTEAKEKFDPRLYDPGNQVVPGGPESGRIDEADLRRGSLITTNILRYDKEFAFGHDVNVLVGQEAQMINQKELAIGIRGTRLPYYDQISSPGVTVIRQRGSTIKENLLSFFGNVNYGYQNKYFFSGSVRRDGSSRFGEDKRFGTYWSTGVGWLITEEKFMKNAGAWVNYLKLRGSIGKAGNAGSINRFTRFDRLTSNDYLGEIAVSPSGDPSNPDVQWEETFTWDVGLEAKFLSGRLSLTADIYKKLTDRLLFNINLPGHTGATTILANIGKMENKGLEFALSADILRTNTVRWNLSANWSTNSNVLVKANNPDAQNLAGVLGNKEGENFNSFYLYKWAGVNPEDGRPQWTDTTGVANSDYNAAEREFVGKSQPDGFGSVTNTIACKGFELSFMLYYQYGYQIYGNSQLNSDGRFPYINQTKEALDRWQKPGDIASNPRRVLNSVDGGYQIQSTRYLFDGDHVRLQNVSLAYNFPHEIINRLHLNSLKIYVQGNNLALWTNFPGRDPANTNLSGISTGAYPMQRTHSIGLNVSF